MICYRQCPEGAVYSMLAYSLSLVLTVLFLVHTFEWWVLSVQYVVRMVVGRKVE